MSYEIAVYHRGGALPSSEQISKLLDLAGWRCALVESVDSLAPAAPDGNAVAIGWDINDDPSGHIRKAVTDRDHRALQRFLDGLCLVEVTRDDAFAFEQEVIDEMRSAGIERSLITKAQGTDRRFGFTSGGDSEIEVEFQWALAGAIGVMVDGVLEDFEEGTLIDCSDGGD